MDHSAGIGVKQATELLEYLALAERLKSELRHSWLSNGRQESVAEHCWMMGLMAMLIAPQLEHKVDLQRVLLLILVHDICETKVGDIPYFEVSQRKNAKAEAEAHAMADICKMFSDQTGQYISDLCYEFEAGETLEAKFARALDHLEVQHQHNLVDIGTWLPIEYDLVYTKTPRPCAHDGTLMALVHTIERQAENKMINAGIDVQAIRARLSV